MTAFTNNGLPAVSAVIRFASVSTSAGSTSMPPNSEPTCSAFKPASA